MVLIGIIMGDIYQNPESQYQEFVNVFLHKNSYGKNRNFVENGNKLWKSIKTNEGKISKISEISKIINSAPPEKKIGFTITTPTTVKPGELKLLVEVETKCLQRKCHM